jgi:PPM family protein phosphatase
MSSDERTTLDYKPGTRLGSTFFAGGAPRVQVRFGAASHVGMIRPVNEDHYAVIRRTRSQNVLMTNVPSEDFQGVQDETHLLAVADGMGGAQAGEWASRLALRTMWDLAGRATSWAMRFRDFEAQSARDRADAYIQEMHQALLDYGQADPELAGMGTTWTSAYIMGWDAILMHVGDSRAYLLRHEWIRQITKDHTLAQVLIDSGIPPEQTCRMRHVLTNSLGGREKQIDMDVQHLVLTDGDYLLLCTDGLSDLVSEREIASQIVRAADPQSACSSLIEMALARGGKDNVTAVLAHVTDEGMRH